MSHGPSVMIWYRTGTDRDMRRRRRWWAATLLTFVIGSLLLCLSSTRALADSPLPSRSRALPVYVGVTAVCSGEVDQPTTVGFTLATLHGLVWYPSLDTGLGISSPGTPRGVWVQREGIEGWTQLPTSSGGEGRLRARVPSDAELLRVVYDLWSSAAVQPRGLNCGG